MWLQKVARLKQQEKACHGGFTTLTSSCLLWKPWTLVGVTKLNLGCGQWNSRLGLLKPGAISDVARIPWQHTLLSDVRCTCFMADFAASIWLSWKGSQKRLSAMLNTGSAMNNRFLFFCISNPKVKLKEDRFCWPTNQCFRFHASGGGCGLFVTWQVRKEKDSRLKIGLVPWNCTQRRLMWEGQLVMGSPVWIVPTLGTDYP